MLKEPHNKYIFLNRTIHCTPQNDTRAFRNLKINKKKLWIIEKKVLHY